MGGGLMQLVAYGAQDIYLTGNPQITFFKVVYRRHTNFARECIQQTLNGTVASSSRVTATISRNGDLLCGMHLQHTLHSASVLNESVQDLDNVEVQIGGQLIDKHYGHWMEAWAELTENKTGREFGTNYQLSTGMGAGVLGDHALTASDGDGTAGNAVQFRNISTDSRVVYTPLMFWFCRNPGLALPLIALQYHEVKVVITFGTLTAGTSAAYSLWCDYVYLDTDERRRFAQVSHEYLIEQVQHQSFSAGTSHDLVLNHPVKELVIAGPWSGGAFTRATGTGMEDTMQLKLNGHERMAARQWTYFSGVQVREHHSGEGSFADGAIGVYSFALEPEEHQPSGTCNFSRIDTAQLVFSVNSAAINVYAVNYNVLRIMSGMGGLAYSN
jgi:hypothetical protein